MGRHRVVLAHPRIVNVGRAVRRASVVVPADSVGSLPRYIIRLILSVGQGPIVSIVLRINAGENSCRGSRCHLIRPWTISAHSPAIMLGRPPNPMSQRMILDWHSVPADRKCELAAVVPNSGALQRKGAVVLSSESDTPLIVLVC